VFDEFHRLNASASPADGMGLGLAIVERACRLLEHPLHLTSEEGGGCCFAIEAQRATRIATLAHAAAPKPDVESESLGEQIVLLIENDAGLRDAIAITLENGGVDVFSCASEAEANALLDEVDIAPDAIVADYQLDDGRLGTDAITNLRKRFGPIPACVISANRSNGLADACGRLGVALIHKPIASEELFEFLRQGAD